MISHRCRHHGRGSVFDRFFTSSSERCAAARVILAISSSALFKILPPLFYHRMRIGMRWASDTCQKTTPLNYHMYSPRLWCHESELHVGPGGRSRAAGLAAALPPALLEGEDDALVDVAAFQLAVGLGGLLHGHGLVRAPAEPGLGQLGDRLIQGTGGTGVGGLGERDAEGSGGRGPQGG